ncbi:MAG: tRNA (N(6)-L-threonylcarbamoyladenosine(37)-C(2))-methylthiotransferase MtaB [Alphaproteobacteria bacterium]|nr:tRNA (N(6)-L-threonylcarbamoyladenosine(37)-C(2))-methylthiotransferase MtaB [Alphaproteobacteria bacterium]
MSIEIVTFGCRLNTYESEVMKRHASAAGLTDTLIFNTCAVTAQAEKQARQAIRKARRAHPHKRIVVTGCAAQIKPESFAGMEEVDVVLGNQEKMEAGEWQAVSHRPSAPLIRAEEAAFGTEKARVNDIMSVKETAAHFVAGFDGRARAFLQVQNGCDHRCTFCIIPYGRGNSRSVPMGEIVAQVRALVENGYHEIVFTGVDVSDYGKDLPGTPTLGQMMRRVLAAVPELKRLRLSSIDAVEVDDDLYRLIAEEPRLMPHLHISLQAGDDMVLKRMKRRHLRHDIVAFCERVKALRPEMVFGADIIAGFPTETDAMFEHTRALIGEIGLTYLHVFPYSARSGTPAAKMPQVPAAVRKARAAVLRAEGEKQVADYYRSLIGTTLEIIIEQDGMSGHAEGFALVKLAEPMPVGSLQRVTVMRADGHACYA